MIVSDVRHPPSALASRRLASDRINCLRHGAIVVNVARGALLDQKALITALSADRNLPVTSPLWGMRNVVVPPHIAAVSPRLFWKRALELFLDNWERYRAGMPLRNQIDKNAGY